jgi:hypothetical protein
VHAACHFHTVIFIHIQIEQAVVDMKLPHHDVDQEHKTIANDANNHEAHELRNDIEKLVRLLDNEPIEPVPVGRRVMAPLMKKCGAQPNT